jgi:hypothetical protein
MMEYVEILSMFIALCSGITAATTSNRDNVVWGKVRPWLEFFSLNVGFAKTQPVSRTQNINAMRKKKS